MQHKDKTPRDDSPTPKSGLFYGVKDPEVVKQQSRAIDIAPTQSQKADAARAVLYPDMSDIDDGPDL